MEELGAYLAVDGAQVGERIGRYGHLLLGRAERHLLILMLLLVLVVVMVVMVAAALGRLVGNGGDSGAATTRLGRAEFGVGRAGLDHVIGVVEQMVGGAVAVLDVRVRLAAHRLAVDVEQRLAHQWRNEARIEQRHAATATTDAIVARHHHQLVTRDATSFAIRRDGRLAHGARHLVRLHIRHMLLRLLLLLIEEINWVWVDVVVVGVDKMFDELVVVVVVVVLAVDV